MSDVTQILTAIDAGDSKAAEQLLTLAYGRHAAAFQMFQPGPESASVFAVHGVRGDL
jgi:hypothetical protein